MSFQAEFRSLLQKIYHRCLISGYDAVECDAAHIIPKYICYKFSLQELLNEMYNGMFLTKSLHTTFDKFIWALDIYDIEWEEEGSDWCNVMIIIKPNKKEFMINQYEGTRIRLPVHCLPFLWIHYHIFVAYNYQPAFNIREAYRDLLSRPEYLQFRENPRVLAEMTQAAQTGLPTVHAIMGKKGFGQEYYVLYQYQPWSQRTWVQACQLSSSIISAYENRKARDNDPDWRCSKSV